jgi:hypothetical protein
MIVSLCATKGVRSRLIYHNSQVYNNQHLSVNKEVKKGQKEFDRILLRRTWEKIPNFSDRPLHKERPFLFHYQLVVMKQRMQERSSICAVCNPYNGQMSASC